MNAYSVLKTKQNLAKVLCTESPGLTAKPDVSTIFSAPWKARPGTQTP